MRRADLLFQLAQLEKQSHVTFGRNCKDDRGGEERASTYDGDTERVYIHGTQAARRMPEPATDRHFCSARSSLHFTAVGRHREACHRLAVVTTLLQANISSNTKHLPRPSRPRNILVCIGATRLRHQLGSAAMPSPEEKHRLLVKQRWAQACNSIRYEGNET